MQANPQYKNAVFQLASTPYGLLEGGVYPQHAYLSHMLAGPTQGEEASIVTAAASIYRKYFFPSQCSVKGFTKCCNLGAHYNSREHNIEDVMVGLHDNIVVTSGYGVTGRVDDGAVPHVGARYL